MSIYHRKKDCNIKCKTFSRSHNTKHYTDYSKDTYNLYVISTLNKFIRSTTQSVQ